MVTRRSVSCPTRRRGGFTLVELLVVVTIIAILVALSAGGIMKWLSIQNVSNSRRMLDKLAVVLKSQWDVVAEKAGQDFDSGAWATVQSYVTPLAGSAGRSTQRVIYIKMRLVQHFPMTFDEALGNVPGQLPPRPVYQQKLKALGITGSSSTTASFESSVLLLMALQGGVSGQKFDPEVLGGASLANFGLPNGTQLQGLADSWGTPLAFFRWPTGNPDLNPSMGSTDPSWHDIASPLKPNYPQSGVNNDPTDPQGLLTVQTWLGSPYPSANVTAFQNAIGYVPPNRNGGNAYSYKLAPLLVSAGADTTLGLVASIWVGANATPDGSGADNDNLTSFVVPK
jgi:prepilin-type N-terminal cleavage/methylation domain-containing protein